VLSEHRCRSCTKTHKASTKPKLENESFKSSLVRQQVCQATHSLTHTQLLRSFQGYAIEIVLLLHEKSQRFRNGFAAVILIKNQSAQSKDERRKRARVVGRRKCAATQQRERWRCKEHKSLRKNVWRSIKPEGYRCAPGSGYQWSPTGISFYGFCLVLQATHSPSRKFLELGILVQALSQERRLSRYHILSDGLQFMWFSVLILRHPILSFVNL